MAKVAAGFEICHGKFCQNLAVNLKSSDSLQLNNNAEKCVEDLNIVRWQ